MKVPDSLSALLAWLERGYRDAGAWSNEKARGAGRLVDRAKSQLGQETAVGWKIAALLIAACLSVPVCTVVYIALTPAENVWPHLAQTVLPRAFLQTLILSAGVGIVTLVIGTGTAWIVTMHRFPGRAILDRLLVLPLAMPTYIVAYCYANLFDYAGPAQTALRQTFGWTSAHDYWFPNVRSLGGAIVVLSAVLYPYVYLAARASFVQQSMCVLEVARTLGRTPLGAFWTIALPLSRPALAAGVSLVIMETFGDLGAVQHFGVETLSASIYSTWLQRGNLAGAAQLACVMLTFVVAMFALENFVCGGTKVHHTTGRYRAIPFQDITGVRGVLVAIACAVPFMIGFLVPFLVLLRSALHHMSDALDGGYFAAAWNSFVLAALCAVVALMLGLILSYAQRVAPGRVTRGAAQVAGLGYALPGTVLAIGMLFPLAALDNGVDGVMRAWFGVSTGLILSGSLFALTFALVIRFLAVALGGIDAGMGRVSPNLDAAARALGATASTALWRVHLPIIIPALGSTGLLVFVDALKELPATLLLRPFNFETLATHVYGFAALEQVEAGALGALTIVLVSLAPLIALHQTVAGGRAGSRPWFRQFFQHIVGRFKVISTNVRAGG